MSDHTNTISFRYAALAMKHKWLILGLIIVSTILAALQISKIDIRNDPDTLLPQTNRYVSTNAYIEQKFGMGNIFVVGVKINGEGDIYQPWFVNMVKDINDELMKIKYANKANFISIAAPKVKNMGVTEDGSLMFKRLIPNSGIDTKDKVLANEQLNFMREGIDGNPVLKPFIIHEVDPKTGKKCFNNEVGCQAKATFVIADYEDKIKASYIDWVRAAVAVTNKYSDDDRVTISIAGEPYFLAWMMVQLLEHWYLFVASILIAFIILFMETKTLRGALFPLFGVGVSIVWTLGLMGFTEFKLTTMMVLTPMLILAVGMGHAIQVTRRYMVSKRQGEDNPLASFNALGWTIVPATLSIATDAVGFATLASVDISFYKAYAYFGMFGMFSLLVTTTTLIPLLMTMFPEKEDKSSFEPETAAWELNMGNAIANMLTSKFKFIPIAVVVVILAISVHYTKIDEGIAKVINAKESVSLDQIIKSDEYDLMPGVEKGIDYAQAAFKANSQPVQDIFKLSDMMPGVITFNIPIRGKKPLLAECSDEYFDALDLAEEDGTTLPVKNCYDPDEDAPQGIINNADIVLAMEKMEDDLRKNPFIGFTASYAQYIKIANMLLMTESGNKPSLNDFKVPSMAYLKAIDPNDDRDPSEIVSMYNGLLDMASSPGDLSSMVQQNYNNGVIMGFVNTMNPRETHSTLKFIQAYIEEHKDDVGFRDVYFGYRNDGASGDTNALSKEANYVEPGVGGFLGAVEATREITYGNWIINPLGTALAIFIIVTLIFRSFIMSGLLMVILLITLFAQYGLAGYYTSVGNWSGNLHFANLVTLSIAMGLGVDYSIYMISRLKEELANGLEWVDAVRITIATTGSSVLISVIVLLGAFIPLIATDLGNTWGLSMYISEAIIIDVFTSLTLLPLMIWWLKPKYIFGDKK